jgi:hypothetical protein
VSRRGDIVVCPDTGLELVVEWDGTFERDPRTGLPDDADLLERFMAPQGPLADEAHRRKFDIHGRGMASPVTKTQERQGAPCLAHRGPRS